MTSIVEKDITVNENSKATPSKYIFFSLFLVIND